VRQTLVCLATKVSVGAFGGFLKWGYAKTMVFSTKMVIHDLDDNLVYPILGTSHLMTFAISLETCLCKLLGIF
jgi:hypothetical protein